jgi:hypothetical protein
MNSQGIQLGGYAYTSFKGFTEVVKVHITGRRAIIVATMSVAWSRPPLNHLLKDARVNLLLINSRMVTPDLG